MGPLAHDNDLHCSLVIKYTDILPFQNKWLINFWLKKTGFYGCHVSSNVLFTFLLKYSLGLFLILLSLGPVTGQIHFTVWGFRCISIK